MVLVFLSGLFLGLSVGMAIASHLADWSFKKYPRFWIRKFGGDKDA